MAWSPGRSSALLAIVVTGSAALAGANPATQFRHVRSERPRIHALLAAGYERSATFRKLVDELERLPGIVYIDETVKLSQEMDGALLHAISGSPQMPILRAVIRSSLGGDYAVSILAHELQHAAEALSAGPLTSSSAMGALFGSLDREPSSSTFETEEARLVAARVIDELRRGRR